MYLRRSWAPQNLLVWQGAHGFAVHSASRHRREHQDREHGSEPLTLGVWASNFILPTHLHVLFCMLYMQLFFLFLTLNDRHLKEYMGCREQMHCWDHNCHTIFKRRRQLYCWQTSVKPILKLPPPRGGEFFFQETPDWQLYNTGGVSIAASSCCFGVPFIGVPEPISNPQLIFSTFRLSSHCFHLKMEPFQSQEKT